VFTALLKPVEIVNRVDLIEVAKAFARLFEIVRGAGRLEIGAEARGDIGCHRNAPHRARSIDLNAAKQLLDDNGLANSPVFLTALEAVLEVLPLSARYTGFDPVKAAAPAASDFEALENLRRLALAEQVPAPKQLELVLAELAEAF
jgi:hypothetical protein